MSLVGKLVGELEINSSAKEFYTIFKDQMSHIPNISKNCFQNVDIHDEDWDTYGHGSINTWYYTLDGKPEVFKERVEYDDEKMAVTLIGLEGTMFDHYTKFKGIYQVVPKGPKHCLAILTLEYEKIDDGCPHPYKYLDLMTNLTKDIESHLKQ